MTYTQEELTDKVYEKVFAVYDIFKNHFGEDKVDLQGLSTIQKESGEYNEEEVLQIRNAVTNPFILVYWPFVTITNENNRSIVIQDLYAKIALTIEGTIPFEYPGFMLTRATYPQEQFVCNYLHSHAPNIPYHSEEFVSPCLGSGPIRGTINSLKTHFDETFWMLFCQELSLYVTVESLTGVPYHKLEEVGLNNDASNNDYFPAVLPPNVLRTYFTAEWRRNFIKYYLEHGHLAVSFNKCYSSGMSFQKFMVDISNCFIDFYNQCLADHTVSVSLSDLLEKGILRKCYYVQGKFKEIQEIRRSWSDNFTGRIICKFKGALVHGKIVESNSQEEGEQLLLLNEIFASYCLEKILLIINFNYKHESSSNNTEGTEAPIPCEKALYI